MSTTQGTDSRGKNEQVKKEQGMYREEYPRPQFVRESWVNLNGEWEFAFDDDHVGAKQEWSQGDQAFEQKIQVPFAFQSQLSGIGDPDVHDNVWYRREFEVPESFAGKNVLLHFGAVDYEAKVWVNGVFVVRHEGGHTPFKADITHALRTDGTPNTLVVQALDESRNLELPRGKQFWKKDSASIFYTRTTGIWQTVWMEAVAPVYLEKVKITPDMDKRCVEIVPYVANFAPGRDLRLRVSISFQGQAVTEQIYSITSRTVRHTIGLPNFNFHERETWWSPENPSLYDISFTLFENDAETDHVNSYFGMRKISIDGGKLCLNNGPYKMKLVLDQGYFPDGNLTPPSDEDIRRDVELTKEMGFNGARKHQKLEDPRYLYWCDVLGLLVWSEAANAYMYSDEYVERFNREWIESIDRDYNHPSIVVWVPLNESWGVPDLARDKVQQHHSEALVYLTKSLDPTRPVISNDGWEHTTSDLITIHDYEWQREVLEERYDDVEKALSLIPGGHPIIAYGYSYRGEPILVTEFGGIAYKKSEWEGWGYSGASSDEDFEQRLRDVIDPLLKSELVQGYCYTQLTDVEQEINGLLTYDRVPKIPLEAIRKINEGR